MKSFSITKLYSWTSSSSSLTTIDRGSEEGRGYDNKAAYRAVVSSELAKLPDSFVYMDIDDEWDDDGDDDDRATDITGESSVTAEDTYTACTSGINTSASSSSISTAAVDALLDFTDESMEEDNNAVVFGQLTPDEVIVASPTYLIDHSDRLPHRKDGRDGYVAVQLGSPTSPLPATLSTQPSVATSSKSNPVLSSRRTYGFHQNPNQRWQHYCDSGAHELLAILQRERQETRHSRARGPPPQQHRTHATRRERKSHEEEVTVMLDPHRLHSNKNHHPAAGTAVSKMPAVTEASTAMFICDEGVSRQPFATPRAAIFDRLARTQANVAAGSMSSKASHCSAVAALSQISAWSSSAMDVDVTETPTNSPTSSSPPSATSSLLSRMWSGYQSARPSRPISPPSSRPRP